MTTKGKGGGGAVGNSSGVWPVYEDLKPNSEWQHDAHSHNLVVFLPGFMKEQLRVSTEGRNIIRVRGERLLSGNKWSRFHEDFEVPENSDMNSVRAKFHEGALTITIPKITFDKPDESAPEKEDIGNHQDKKRSKESDSSKQKQSGIGRVEAEKMETTTTVAKEEGKPERSKELGEDENHKMMEKMKPIKRPDEGKTKEIIEPSRVEHGALTKEVVNMGAAALVIVAFSAYVTYKFVSGDDKK